MTIRAGWWDGEDDPITPEQVEEFDYVLASFEGASMLPGWTRVACLRCRDSEGKDDKKASLGYNAATGGYSCFRCGMHGSLPPTYRERISDDDSLEPYITGVVHPASALVEPEKPVEPCEGYVPIFEEPGWSAEAYELGRQYLLGKRGLTPQACFEAGVGAVYGGRLGGRIVVPIPDYQAATRPWRGWVARDALGRPGALPYRYAKGMRRIGLLYNEPALYVATDAPCYIVEGTLDVLSLWPDAVGVLGKPLDSQLEMFCCAKRPLVVCLDGDAWESEGQKLAWDLQHQGMRAGNIRLPPRVDPDECPRGWLDAEAQRVLA